MYEEIKEALGKEILRELDDISKMETGSQEKSKAIDDLVKLYKLKNDDGKMEFEYETFYSKQEAEERMKRETREYEEKVRAEEAAYRQKKEKKEFIANSIDRACSHVIKGCEIAVTVISIAAYCGLTDKGFQFEQTGAVTSLTFKNHLSRGFSMLLRA